MESSERPCLPASSRSSRKNGRERSGSSARFSPTPSTPACASRLISSSPTYFVATTTVTSGPTSERIRSRLAPICSADVSNDSLAARDAAVATVREEEPGLARRAAPVPLHGADAGGAQRALGRLRDVGAVPLPGHRGGGGVRLRRRAQTAAVLDHAPGLVGGEDAEVERLERPVADAAQPGGEGDAVGARGLQ